MIFCEVSAPVKMASRASLVAELMSTSSFFGVVLLVFVVFDGVPVPPLSPAWASAMLANNPTANTTARIRMLFRSIFFDVLLQSLRWTALSCLRVQSLGDLKANCQKMFLGGLAAGILLGFPGALRTLRFGKVPVYHAIIDVTIADRAQRLVVQAGLTGSFAQFFRELVEGLEMIGGCRDFGLGGLEKLLVSLIDQTGNLRADQETRLGKETHTAIIGLLDGRGTIQLLQEDAVLSSRSVQNVKAVVAKPIDGFFICALLRFLRHDSPVTKNSPVTDFVFSNPKTSPSAKRASG